MKLIAAPKIKGLIEAPKVPKEFKPKIRVPHDSAWSNDVYKMIYIRKLALTN